MKNNDNRILVILDLDETLIHATKKPLFPDWQIELEEYKIFKRPHLDSFLAYIKTAFKVAVWSSASDDYVHEVVKHIFPKDYPLVFVWGRSKCTLQYDYQNIDDLGYSDYFNHLNYAKILKKVKKSGFSTLEKTLIIDDTPRKAKYNYGNAIYPKEFNGDPKDVELDLLIKYLESIKEIDNVRTIEKRGWRDIVLKKN